MGPKVTHRYLMVGTGKGSFQMSSAVSSVAFFAPPSVLPSSTTLFSSPGATARNVPVPAKALLARTVAPGQRSSRITGLPATGVRVEIWSRSNSLESRISYAVPVSGWTCRLCSSMASVL